jgi:hypothetical protein
MSDTHTAVYGFGSDGSILNQNVRFPDWGRLFSVNLSAINYCAHMHRLLLRVSAISFCMIPPVDIFRVVERGQHIWIEPSETVKEALMRVQSLGMGEYLITNQRTGFRLSLTVDVSAVTGSLGSHSPHLV